MSKDREYNVFMAKLAEQSERYDDMVEYMRKVATSGEALSVDERNLLSVAYKNVAGARRASWRVLSTIEHKEAGQEDDWKRKEITTYKKKVEDELIKICEEILMVLDKVVPNDTEANVFYKKMAGDYYRYRAEFDSNEKILDQAKKAYEEATEVAKTLPPTNPIRLGLALNFSVFYYEILNEHEEACKLAKSAFDEAVAELDTLPEESYKDATLIMQLLRDNLTLWSSSEASEFVPAAPFVLTPIPVTINSRGLYVISNNEVFSLLR